VKSIKKPRPLGSFLRDNHQLRSLVEQLHSHADLLEQVRNLLPEALRPHCHAAHIQDQQLVVYTDSPAWVMRLRFSSTQLLSGLRATRPNVRGVRVRVQLPQGRPHRPAPRAQLTEAARQHLQQAARAMDEGPLRAALERLSRSG